MCQQELQELNDHCKGLENQKVSLERHVFPPLPPLQAIQERFEEEGLNTDYIRMAKLANAALCSAEDEISALKKGELRRQQVRQFVFVSIGYS